MFRKYRVLSQQLASCLVIAFAKERRHHEIPNRPDLPERLFRLAPQRPLPLVVRGIARRLNLPP